MKAVTISSPASERMVFSLVLLFHQYNSRIQILLSDYLLLIKTKVLNLNWSLTPPHLHDTLFIQHKSLRSLEEVDKILTIGVVFIPIIFLLKLWARLDRVYS